MLFPVQQAPLVHLPPHQAAHRERPKRKGKDMDAKKNGMIATRANEAAAKFLYRRGYDILEEGWSCEAGEVDIIAKEEDTLVFVEVLVERDGTKDFPVEDASIEARARRERLAIRYLAASDKIDCPVRFDVISLVIINSDKAMIRHHTNVMSNG